MKTKILKWSIATLMLLCMTGLKSWAQTAITTPQDLKDIGNVAGMPITAGSSYYLAADIDMTGVDWVPIGVKVNADGTWTVANFLGTFDGRSHVIRNLTVDVKKGGEGGGGLFYRLAAATPTTCVKDLGLENVNVTTTYSPTPVATFPIGGLTGSVGSVVDIHNVYVTGTINSVDPEVGGIFGRGLNNPGAYTIQNCYTNVVITGKDQVGGLIGNLNGKHQPTIENCYAAGYVTATGGTASGLVGSVNTANAGDVTFKSSVVLADRVSGTTTHPFCATISQITGASTNYYARSDVFSSYSETSRLMDVETLKTQTFYEGIDWSFFDPDGGIWKWEEGNFPIFKWQDYPDEMTDADAIAAAINAIESATFTVDQTIANTEALVKTWLAVQINNLILATTGITVLESDITLSNFVAASSVGDNGSFDFTVSLSKNSATPGSAANSGTIKADGTPIYSVADFAKIRSNLAGKFYLRNDIDMSGVTDWMPIGKNETDLSVFGTAFTGTLDGQNHVIKNLKYEYAESGTTGGIFGRIGPGGRVCNLELRNLTITGSNTGQTTVNGVGALAADINGATIEQVAVVGCTLTTATLGVGGIAGNTVLQAANTIKDVYIDPTTTITGNSKVGGVVGNFNAAGSVVNMENCYVAATIKSTGTTPVYGLIGGYTATPSAHSTLKSVFVMAKAAQGTNLQPFCTDINSSSTNYFACTSPGYFSLTDIGTGTAVSLSDLQTETTYSKAGVNWDFDAVWKIQEGRRFPILQWQNFPSDFIIEATGPAKTAFDYKGGNKDGNYGDVIIQSDDNSTGQFDLQGGNLTVNGVVKLEKTFSEQKWYAVGFPFDINSVRCGKADYDLQTYDPAADKTAYRGDFWLKTYNGVDDKFYDAPVSTTIDAGGYILEVPDGLTNTPLTFSSKSYVVLSNSDAFSGVNDSYTLTYNPSVANLQVSNGANHFYAYEYNKPNNFALINDGAPYTLKPFESAVITGSSAKLRSSMSIDEVTELPALNWSNDKVVATEYYNLMGARVAQPIEGNIYLVKRIYESGKTSVVKQITK